MPTDSMEIQMKRKRKFLHFIAQKNTWISFWAITIGSFNHKELNKEWIAF